MLDFNLNINNHIKYKLYKYNKIRDYDWIKMSQDTAMCFLQHTSNINIHIG